MLPTALLLEGKPERRTYETTTHKTRAHQVRNAGARIPRGRERRTLFHRVSAGEDCPCRRRRPQKPVYVYAFHGGPSRPSSRAVADAVHGATVHLAMQPFERLYLHVHSGVRHIQLLRNPHAQANGTDHPRAEHRNLGIQWAVPWPNLSGETQ